MIYLAEFFSEWEMFQSCKENQDKHFVFNNVFPKTVPFEKPLKNIVQPDTTHGKIRRRLHKHTQNMYEGWNFNSGNYLFTTDTK